MSTPAPTPGRRNPVVMVIDDATTMLRAAKSFLEPAYDVITVSDGFSGLAAVQDARPDLVLLDVSMPRLDGYNTCLAIKQNPQFKDLPIVMMTSKDSAFDKARGQLMGCDAYITKPFTREQLVTTVERFLRSM